MHTTASRQTYPIHFRTIRGASGKPVQVACRTCVRCGQAKPLGDFTVLLNGEAATRVGHKVLPGFRFGQVVHFKDFNKNLPMFSQVVRPNTEHGPVCVACE